MTVTRRLARPMLASTFVFGGIQALKNTPALAVASKPVNDEIRDLAGRVAPQVKVPADDQTLVRINAGVQIVAGLGLATGRAPRLCALALATSVVPTTVAGHPFWEEKDKTERTRQTTHFFKNLSMLGGLVLAALDTEGRPGVTWRTTHAVGAAGKAVGAAGTAVGSAGKGVTQGVTKGVAKNASKNAKSARKSAKQLTRSAKQTARNVRS
jgi:putative oxidoreductase